MNDQTEIDDADDPAQEFSDLERAIDPKIRAAFLATPSAGKGRRWYDYPYRLLGYALDSGVGRKLPRGVRRGLNVGMNWLLQFNVHDRNKKWPRGDSSQELAISEGEHVTTPGLWLAEVFTPSRIDYLTQSIRRNKWNRGRLGWYELKSTDWLAGRRESSGFSWSQFARILDHQSPLWDPEAKRDRLPEPFDSVSISAYQVSSGLTIVVAYFAVSVDRQRDLDNTWHADHNPTLELVGGWPRARGRLSAGMLKSQSQRDSMHSTARAWMHRKFPGIFAASSAPQPLIDLLLLDERDPMSGRAAKHETTAALGAIGIDENTFFEILVSDGLPGLVLEQAGRPMSQSMIQRSTFGLWGKRDQLIEASDFSGYGGTDDAAIGYFVDERIKGVLALLSVGELLSLENARVARIRDSAQRQHGRVNRRRLKSLRAEILSTSLDIQILRSDMKQIAGQPRLWPGEIAFHYVPATPEKRSAERDLNDSLNVKLRPIYENRAKELAELDSQYRALIETVASLGTSIDAFRIQRWALGIALLSLVVAFLTLVVTDPDLLKILLNVL